MNPPSVSVPRRLGAAVALAAILSLCLAVPTPAQERVETSLGALALTPMATGLTEPWGLAFLPDGRFLVTERDGRLTLFPAQGGAGQPVSGVPEVYARGQGGLLDVMVPRDFARTRAVYLSFAQPRPGGAGTAMGRGWLSADGTRLEGFTTLFAAPHADRGWQHFGSRLVEARDGTIFLTIGERGAAPRAQDPSRANGKVLHLTRDGQPVSPAPPDTLPGLYSLGHRNPQGATLDARGQLWVIEHGAEGGDELNRVERGRNYGWPVIAYGQHYGGGKIGIGTASPGMEQPVLYWDPSIAPSGLMIHSGAMFPEWRGDFFTGSLKFNYIARLDPEANYTEERIAAPRTGRVRDVREGPDGAIWFLSVHEGAVFRLSR